MYRVTKFVVPSETGNLEYDLAYVQDWRDNFANVVPRTTRLPGTHGGYDEYGVGDAPAEIGNVQGTLKMYKSTDASMVTWLDTIRSMSRQRKGRLFMQPQDSSEDERWCIARLNNLTTNHSESAHTGVIMEVRFSFQANDPHWYTQGTASPTWGFFTWGSAYWGGSATAQAVSGVSTTFTETVSDGTVPTLPIITISCGAGETAENITIQRRVGGVIKHQITISDTLTAGDEVVINCRAKSVKKNGVDAYANFTANRGDFFKLLVGDNTIRVTMTNSSDACSIKFSYYHTYV